MYSWAAELILKIVLICEADIHTIEYEMFRDLFFFFFALPLSALIPPFSSSSAPRLPNRHPHPPSLPLASPSLCSLFLFSTTRIALQYKDRRGGRLVGLGCWFIHSSGGFFFGIFGIFGWMDGGMLFVISLSDWVRVCILGIFFFYSFFSFLSLWTLTLTPSCICISIHMRTWYLYFLPILPTARLLFMSTL